MTFDDVQGLKKALLEPIQEQMRELTASAESAEPLRRDARMAVGYSRRGAAYGLEIRVGNKRGKAWRDAEAMRKRYPNEVNVIVVQSTEIPSSKAVQGEEPFSRRLLAKPDEEHPLCLGASVSHRDSLASGSLGAFVRDEKDVISFLSCSHVIGLSGTAKKRDPVFHPGRRDVPQLNIANLVGSLAEATVLSRAGANTLDAGYAHVEEDVDYLGNVIPPGVGAPGDFEGKKLEYDPNVEFEQDMELAKVGRTTGYTVGLLNAFSLDNVSVSVPGIGLVFFDNCIEVRWRAVNQPFTKPGDSGALVFTVNKRKALGLHFAGGDVQREGRDLKVSYACQLSAILSEYQFNLSWDEP